MSDSPILARPSRSTRVIVLAIALAIAGAASGCYPPQILTLRSGLDSLRTVIDTMAVHDSIAFHLIGEVRRDIAEQKDVLLSTRATSGSTTQELFDQMSRLEGKLDEAMGRFQQQQQQRPPTTSSAAEASQLYEQGTQDLTQGRYPLAIQNFREFIARDRDSDLADNAQYGVGEGFYAQSKFDSAAVEYARVESLWPRGDKVPAALYKLALSQEKLGQADQSRNTLEGLTKRFPQSGEAQLARERLGTARRR
jgi:tol-pal system protein YbgF